ncbi:MAG: polyribonucleotide nucleotidyltransferase, partial [Chloroflexota bacterium]
MPYTFQCLLNDKPLIVETGKLATLAGASAVIRYGDTEVLATVCRSQSPREGADFLPLTVDYEERHYAVGRIPGSFFRREGRPSQDATLAARLTDRPLRPLFPKGFYYDIQIILTTLSADQENAPDILGICGGSTVLTLSDIPFNGPVAAVRVGYKDGEWLVNPTYSQMEQSLFEVVVAGTKEKVMMLEAGAKQASEELIMEAIRRGHQALQPIIKLQEEMRQQLGKPKMEVKSVASPGLEDAMVSFLNDRMNEISNGPQIAPEAVDKLRRELIENLVSQFPKAELGLAFDAHFKDWLKQRTMSTHLRPDGRGFEQLRPISAEVQVLP